MKKQTHLKEGDKFHRLTVVRYDHTGNHHRRYFLFKCDCGNLKIILGSGVVSGNTKSCGCLSTEVKKARRLPNDAGVIYQIILGYKRHAKRRGFKFLLTRKEFADITSKDCYYCGSKPSNIKRTKNYKEGYIYNGIDRVDSSKDYMVDNVVPCCRRCNQGKMDMSKKEFLSWITKVYNMAKQWGQ